ncbi:type IV secretion protein Rhs [Geodermatophilus sp. TF02-6]|uniref:DUF6531 domain-containing protein n=1 Tax=Geodermatophilus sp. TF02-6 TaxID=2250575 RepID=UPI000DE91A91|nr:DUF6531 domain-containing protein [Geodermatophilus sp. TF02-6]RBY80899.1 type IV secretion protein Rhs [Geodermatophilus sp. TF02-6]
MSDWHVVGRDGDPAPGDPSRTRELAARLHHQAELAERNTDRLRSVAANEGALRMEGDYAPKFRDVLTELPDQIGKLARAYQGCGNAVLTFAGDLERAKSQAGSALRQGRDADDRYQGAMREIRAALPDDRELAFASGLSLATLEARMIGLDDGVKIQVRAAAARARDADTDRDRARRLADQAAELRGDAEQRCVDGINEALEGSGIKNKSWFRKAWDFASAPFRSWDAFVELCKVVALVAGVAALFISGPIGAAILAAALVTGAAVAADTVAKYRRGEASLGDVALEAVGLIPAGRVVGAAGKLAGNAARLAGAAQGLARGLGTAGRTVGGALHAVGRKAVPAIRSGITWVRRNAIPTSMRNVRVDPIDVASGEMLLQQTDAELPGMLPLVLTRTHLSSYRVGRWFGPSWASTLDQRLEVDGAGVCYAAEDGTLLVYPPVPAAGHVLPEEGPRLPLARTDDDTYTVTDDERGLVLHFGSTSGPDAGVLPLTAVVDRNGHRIDLEYDGDGTLTEVRHSGGYRVAVDTRSGLVTGLRLLGRSGDVEQVLVRFGYDGARRLTDVVNSSGVPLRFGYDSAGRMTQWQDRNGTQYRYAYDAYGRCVRTSGSDGCLDGTITYDVDNRVSVVTDSLGHSTTYHLNEALQVIREVDPLGHATESEWDRYDRLLARTDPLGRTIRYAYDEAGDLTSVERPDGSTISAAYDAMRLPVTVIGPDGAVWRREYDERGNLTAVTDPMGARTSYLYDELGRLVEVMDALGHVRRIETDAAGLPVAVTDPLGATTRYERDVAGRAATVIDPLGATTRFRYTVEGKLAWRALPDGATERWSYDGEGNLVEHLDAMGSATRIEVTHFDLPAARTAPDGARLVFSYDTELRLVAVTNPQGLMWRYEYDAAGNLVREIDFNGRVLRYAYDAGGQLVERVNGAGEVTRFVRDPLGNVVEQRAEDALAVFSYDPAGRVVRATNADADVRFERDPLGRVLSETCNGRSVESTYDVLGRRVRRRTPSGAESLWEYDANDRPVALHTAGHRLDFSYDAAGREIERRLDTGVVIAQDWDANSQLLAQTVTAPSLDDARPESARQARVVQQRKYHYRADGYITQIDDLLSGSRRFDLDPVGRITAVTGAGWTERYAYDSAGNITTGSWPASPETLSSDAQGDREYAGTQIRRAGAVRYEHDSQGRVVIRQQKRLSAKPRTWRYTWDGDDRLVAAETPQGERWQYRYDSFGRRTAKERVDRASNQVEGLHFAWDGLLLAEEFTSARPYQLRVPSISRARSWDWFPGTFQPLSQSLLMRSVGDESGSPPVQEFHLIVTELSGAPAELLNGDGEPIWQGKSSLWGDAVGPRDRDRDCPLMFPGQYFDGETQLAYNHHRYYSMDSARYQSDDPIGLRGGSNVYSYPKNPFAESDPLGLTPCRNNRAGAGNPGARTDRIDLSAAAMYPGRRLPLQQGPAGAILVKRAPDGSITNYAVYDSSGLIIKRVDLTGRPHAGIPTPHTVEYHHDVNPLGKVFPRQGDVRAATPDEIP